MIEKLTRKELNRMRTTGVIKKATKEDLQEIRNQKIGCTVVSQELFYDFMYYELTYGRIVYDTYYVGE